MRVLVLSSVYPSPSRPTFGVFVRERVRAVARHCDVQVISPVPWFPFDQTLRGRRDFHFRARDDGDALRVYRPRVLCPPGLAKSLDGIAYFVSLIRPLRSVARNFPFDLIDAHFSFPDGVAATLLGRWLSRPVVITLRGSHDIRHARYTSRRIQIVRALSNASAVIAVSDSLRQFAADLGIRRSVRVIRNAVDPLRFARLSRDSARAHLGLHTSGPVLLTVARLAESKGQHLIIQALPKLLSHYPNLLYAAVGDADPRNHYRATLERLVDDLGVRPHVLLVGACPHDTIPLWLSASDLFCLATRAEGCSNAIVEALACGLPVVTTQVGGNSELVRHGEDGFIVPYGDVPMFQDALLRALEFPWDRESISTRARTRTWETVAAEVLSEFCAVTQRRP